MNEAKQSKKLEALSCIDTDIGLFFEGSWEPDNDSMDAIGDMVKASPAL